MEMVPVRWYQRPEHAVPDIESQEELMQLGRFVAPMLNGGIGNIMFQLAATHAYALDNNITTVCGYFRNYNDFLTNFRAFGLLIIKHRSNLGKHERMRTYIAYHLNSIIIINATLTSLQGAMHHPLRS